MNGYERTTAVLEGGRPDCTPLMPITMMFAADQIGIPYGKYASDYRQLVEAQILTAEKFDFDYVSAISDPAREAADWGANVKFFDDQPPAIDEVQALLADKHDLSRLEIPEPTSGGRMHDRINAIELFKQRIGGKKLIEGWIEGPCAEAADLRGINRLMTDFLDDPKFAHDLLDLTLELALRFAVEQIAAGADIIGIGDAAASLVGPRIYEEFVLPREKIIVDRVQASGAKVRLHICGNISRILEPIGTLGCDMIDVDSMVSLEQARKEVGPEAVLAGNINPVAALRDGTPDSIRREIGQCHRQSGERYIIAAGCEVPRDTPEENVRTLADYARGNM
jgi:MtaA/CmuA family methyltransferase